MSKKQPKIINHLLLSASVIALGLTSIPSISFAGGGGSSPPPPATCNSTHSRAVNCLDYQGNAVADSYCATVGTKPATTQGCTYTCPPPPPPPDPYYNGSGDGDGAFGGDGDGSGRTGGGWVDTNGDGRGDTPANRAPPGNWNSSDNRGGRADGDTRINDRGYISGNHDDGDEGRSSEGDRSGDTVLCTYFHRIGELPSEDYYTGFIYSAQNAHPATWRGYHTWAIPYVRYLYNNPGSFLEKIIRPIVLHRAAEISYQAGISDKPDYLGKVFRLLIEPLSFMVGLVATEKDPSSLYTREEMRLFAQHRKKFKEQKTAQQTRRDPTAMMSV